MTLNATRLRVLVRSTFDPRTLRVWSTTTGPSGAGIESAEYVEGRWLDRGDGATLAEIVVPADPVSWTEVWLRVENCQPVPVGRLVAIREGGQGG